MKPQQYYKNQILDILKFFSAILIAFHHFQGTVGGKLKLFNFFGGSFYFGYLVELFFLISGILIYKYIKLIDNGMNFKDFFLRRFLRYSGMVIVSVIFYECVIFICNQYTNINPQFPVYGRPKCSLFYSIITAFSIQCGWCFEYDAWNYVNAPLWYISVLQFCYIAFYFLTYISRKININVMYIYIAVITVAIGVRTYNICLPFINTNISRGIVAFFTGLIIVEIKNKIGLNNRKILFGALLTLFIIPITWSFKRNFVYENFTSFSYVLLFLYYPSLLYFLSSMKCLRRIVDSNKYNVPYKVDTTRGRDCLKC